MVRVRIFLGLVLVSFGLGAQGVKDSRALRPQQDITPPVVAEARTALVIGNGSYLSAPLRNPVQDARAISEALTRCGFRVTTLENTTRERMVKALRDFGQTIQGGGVGLFYFAGHGMQVKGKNYLVPVDADLGSEDEVAFSTLDADAVLAKMETARNRLNILILDACRNNPFGRSFRSSSQGLAQMDAPAGSYIAFATSPGRTAADGTGSHGLYTEYLLGQLTTPGLKVEDVFKRVRAGVMRDSKEQQVPWESSSITGDFFFLPGLPEAAEAVAPPPDRAALTLLDRCMEARGGTRTWQAVDTLRTRCQWPMDNTSSPVIRDESRGGGVRLEIHSPPTVGKKVLGVMIVNGTRAVGMGLSEDRSKVIDSPTPMTALEILFLKNIFGLSDPLLAAAEGKAKWQDAGAAQVEGRSMRLLRVNTQDGQEYLYRIDEATFLPSTVHATLTAGEAKQEVTFRLGNFRTVGALKLPFSLEMQDKESGRWIPRETLEEVVLNPTFPANHFSLPEIPPLGTGTGSLDPEVAEGERLFQEALADYENGAPRNPRKTDDLLHRAAAKGHVQAMVTLAQNYQTGTGETQSDDQAAWWFLQAAELGSDLAQVRTAKNLENGTGVEKNLKEALRWYQKAAANGDGEAKEALTRLGAK